MVDQLGDKPVTLRIARAARVDVPRPVEGERRDPPAQPARADLNRASLARELATAPPVDTDRVARIRKAIADGKFPISPATIADRLLALKMNWDGNDAA
jgi:negative regulator of flagellin synthesis FlgM